MRNSFGWNSFKAPQTSRVIVWRDIEMTCLCSWTNMKNSCKRFANGFSVLCRCVLHNIYIYTYIYIHYIAPLWPLWVGIVDYCSVLFLVQSTLPWCLVALPYCRTGPKDAATYRSQSQILVPMVCSLGPSKLERSWQSFVCQFTWEGK